MLADSAGAGEEIEVVPGFQEEDGEVRAAVQGQGEEGVYRCYIYACAFTVVGLRSGGSGQGEALGLGEGQIGNGIGQEGFLRGGVQLDAVALPCVAAGRYLLFQYGHGIREGAFEVAAWPRKKLRASTQ